MAGPLSVTASIISLTVPALHSTRLLLNDLERIKDAPKTVKRLTDDVRSVDAALELLQGVEDTEWKSLGTTVAEQSKTTIKSCRQACDVFKTGLQRWTKHSEDGKLAWQDRAIVGFFKKDQIKAISEQLQNCKLTIATVVSIATLYGSVRNSHITDEIKEMISTMQAEVKGAITTADKQLVVLEDNLREMNLSDDDEEAAIPAEGKAEALQQLEEERKALDVSRKLLDELLAKSKENAIAKAALRSQGASTTITFGDYNSGLQAGVIHGAVNYGK
ncbi:hypothetical protein CC78DRAFT_524459 [Lojkania enalia]|uniref:Azaphilone pigments biosynthesis cluster protein L N-terminal domain-containing protein n=1 Tax=Lojkania enalia TaxID=147567 RepID=A0A9P4MW22_9PLEO|nr:hypothetical protein CC78DRAFT_524459 [Didymosphaeria enalia]